MNGNGGAPVIQSDAVMVAVGERDGKVVMTFSSAVQWLPLDPENARQIAEQLARSAYTARFGLMPDGAPRSMVTESLRRHMRARTTIIVRSLLEQHKGPAYIAAHVVDNILKDLA